MIEAVLPFPNIDPVLIHIYGPISIRWYALSYIAGLVLGWSYVVSLLRQPRLWAGPPFQGKPPATADDIGDLFVWVTLGVIIGGRLGFVLLYGVIYCGWNPGGPACGGLPGAYLTDPVRIIAAWEGGMSFHGGLTGVIIAVWLFCRSRKLNLLAIADLIAAAAPIGLFFGRLANFINGELWGKTTDVPWAMVFPNALPPGVPRHPSQLYEAALEGIVLFLLLRVLIFQWQIHRRPGLVVAWFLLGYGAFRFIVEFFRDSESKLYGWFSMGQALSLPMWAAAAFFVWYALRTPSKAAPCDPLKDKILRLIRANGPMTIAHYMQIALMDPEHGYYRIRDPLGRAGDFITAPEVSQMFGELIGLFFVQTWEDRGRPQRFHLVELGPGRGTLMADMLRAARVRPDFVKAARVMLLEASPALRAIQQKTLADAKPVWIDGVADIPSDTPLFLVANEFFDALPIRQFVKSERGWHERMIAAEGDELIFVLTPEAVPGSLIPGALRQAKPGAVFEINPGAQAIIAEIVSRIAEQGGAALIVDYGYAEPTTTGTFQAVKSHAYADPLAEPGEADLTAHVDFALLSATAMEAGASILGPVSQGSFLASLGIGARAEQLKRVAPEEASDIDAAVGRLTSPEQMGTLFKVMAIYDGRTSQPSGFAC